MSQTTQHLTYAEVASGAEGFVAARVSEESGRPLLFVVPSDREMEVFAAQLAFFTPAAEILKFPAWDCLPYDRVSPRQQIMAERMATLASLLPLPMGEVGKRSAPGEGALPHPKSSAPILTSPGGRGKG